MKNILKDILKSLAISFLMAIFMFGSVTLAHYLGLLPEYNMLKLGDRPEIDIYKFHGVTTLVERMNTDGSKIRIAKLLPKTPVDYLGVSDGTYLVSYLIYGTRDSWCDHDEYIFEKGYVTHYIKAGTCQ